MSARAPGTTMKILKEVGRYAVGIDWADGHQSILPYRELRLHCPCDACAARTGDVADAALQLVEMRRIGDVTLLFRWADGHETLLVGDELRALCRCAYCAGEPEYPITKR